LTLNLFNMKRKELLQNKGYWIAKIQMDLYEQLKEYMKKHNLNRSQFAKQIGVTKGYVSQVLQGNFNHRISKLVELSLAIDKVPKLEFVQVDEYIEQEDDNSSESYFIEVFAAAAENFNEISYVIEDLQTLEKSLNIDVKPEQKLNYPETA